MEKNKQQSWQWGLIVILLENSFDAEICYMEDSKFRDLLNWNTLSHQDCIVKHLYRPCFIHLFYYMQSTRFMQLVENSYWFAVYYILRGLPMRKKNFLSTSEIVVIITSRKIRRKNKKQYQSVKSIQTGINGISEDIYFVPLVILNISTALQKQLSV